MQINQLFVLIKRLLFSKKERTQTESPVWFDIKDSIAGKIEDYQIDKINLHP